ncbi:unnamed protein product [Camellia sinensis]
MCLKGAVVPQTPKRDYGKGRNLNILGYVRAELGRQVKCFYCGSRNCKDEADGATVRNACLNYGRRSNKNEESEKAMARNVMRKKMSIKQLHDSMSFYNMMGQICSEVMEEKFHATVTHIIP